jgi:hypothetical protein
MLEMDLEESESNEKLRQIMRSRFGYKRGREGHKTDEERRG